MTELDATPLVDTAELEQAAEVLRVLAHPHRLRFVDLLLNRRLRVGELAEAAGLAPAAVSQHLNHMRAHGILAVERDGREAYYHVVSPHAHQLLACIREHRHSQSD